ncbi:LysR family transcriptional regulator [Sutcliffiella horikoshii]|uniref:LysR family transcriptional regulator n=1 Tax=Sutcliffiella horikoshii TaxID=79883 RepID=A0A5D4T2C7_9BACI|nr:LysR family transcriptional regulator [Sutcliffiella horikoshii]TYS69763.1 LysR family transcriptional regulator [Sutcliffiella horikoshii]
MTLDQLEYIVEVFRAESISVAADNLHVSQSGISRAISNLENELGVKIFRRSKLGTTPTEEGKKIIKYAYDALLIIGKIKEEAKLYTGSITGNLKVATTTGYMKQLLKPLSDYKNEFPNINIEVLQMGTKDIINSIQEHKIDIGIITIYGDYKTKNNNLDFDIFVEGKMKLCVSKNSPLALSRAVTPQEILNNQKFVVYDNDFINWFHSDFSNKYGPVDVLFTSNNTDVIKEAILNNLAVCFATDFAMKSDPYVLSGQIILVDLWDYHTASFYFGRVISNGRYLSASANKFLDFIKSDLDT